MYCCKSAGSTTDVVFSNSEAKAFGLRFALSLKAKYAAIENSKVLMLKKSNKFAKKPRILFTQLLFEDVLPRRCSLSQPIATPVNSSIAESSLVTSKNNE
jgi:hypothetical protein